MKNTPRKILDISKTDTHLNIDVRIEIPLTHCSGEFVNDVILAKESFINGCDLPEQPGFRIETSVGIGVGDDGEEVVEFTKSIVAKDKN